MANKRHSKEWRITPGKITHPRSKVSGNEGGYKEFRIGDLFDIVKGKRLTQNDMIAGDMNFIGATASNNGITAKISNSKYIHPANTITVSYNGSVGEAFYQASPFWASDDINVLYSKFKLNSKIALFILAPLTKKGKKYGYAFKWKKEIMEEDKISLPTKSNGEIDFGYMEKFIEQIENERWNYLDQFLDEAGLKDCTLSQKERQSVKDFQNGIVKFNEFKIGNFYNKVELRKNIFDKRKDTSPIRTKEFSLPLVNAKCENNGIMYYGNEDKFDSVEMSIDIIQNGAVATGNVYPQLEKTGVLWDAYLIKSKQHKETENTIFFHACAIHKSIKPKFHYDNKATWDRVCEEYMMLPITSSGDIDYEFMENFISAYKKKTIQNLYKWREEKNVELSPSNVIEYDGQKHVLNYHKAADVNKKSELF